MGLPTPDLHIRFLVFLTDIDPDTGRVSQITPVAETELESYAIIFSEHLNNTDDTPSRKYSYVQLYY